MILRQDEKKGFYELMVKYDNVYPELGNSLSKFIQNKSTQKDLLQVFNHLDPETLEYEEFAFLDDTLGLELEILMDEEPSSVFDWCLIK